MEMESNLEVSESELELYDKCIAFMSTEKRRKKKGDPGPEEESLEHLDKWWRLVLPDIIKRRELDCFITLDELVKVMKWKLQRGKFRPLLRLILQNTDKQVKDASSKAFSSLTRGNLQQSVKQLSVLKGVGPATASAILAAHSPNVAPFMSDEALEAVIGARTYTLPEYLELAGRINDIALAKGGYWSSLKVELALYSKAMLQKYPSIFDNENTANKTDQPKQQHGGGQEACAPATCTASLSKKRQLVCAKTSVGKEDQGTKKNSRKKKPSPPKNPGASEKNHHAAAVGDDTTGTGKRRRQKKKTV